MRRGSAPTSGFSLENSDESQVAILDAGAQYAKVIDRRIRNLAVKSVILPIDTPLEKLQKYRAIIISGGPEDVFNKNAPKPAKGIFEIKKPILGICYGMQLMNYHFGGSVEKGNLREDGQFTIKVQPNSKLFNNLASNQKVLLTHGNSVTKLAPGFSETARSDKIIAAIENPSNQLYGVQFHPEVDLTLNGSKMFSNFLFGIARLEASYHIGSKLQSTIEYIKSRIGNKDALVFVSGGVDSTVCAALLARVIDPKKIHAVHIDTGLMRMNESALVKDTLKNVGIHLELIDASQTFQQATTQINNKKTTPLNRTTDPEIKRKIIGDTFVHVMNSVVTQLKLDPNSTMLVQGTLRPDLIESASSLASGAASVIKTHHNDSKLVRELREKGKVIEPLQEFHKDEVREIGTELGLPQDLVWRQPFPGPGLGIRILCHRNSTKNNFNLQVNKIKPQLEQFNTSEIKVSMLPIKTVGVQGDGRSYSNVVGLSGKPKWPKLFKLALEIPRNIHNVNRVVYIFGLQLTEDALTLTETYPSTKEIELLRCVDQRVNQILHENKLDRKLSQVPVILTPLNFGVSGNRSIVIRPFITNDFMTGRAAVPGRDFDEKTLNTIVTEVLKIRGISRVMYDLTSKPPGTTEWE